ncbi:hypothetical protein GCM10023319_23900 [Nocardia iowensis]
MAHGRIVRHRRFGIGSPAQRLECRGRRAWVPGGQTEGRSFGTLRWPGLPRVVLARWGGRFGAWLPPRAVVRGIGLRGSRCARIRLRRAKFRFPLRHFRPAGGGFGCATDLVRLLLRGGLLVVLVAAPAFAALLRACARRFGAFAFGCCPVLESTASATRPFFDQFVRRKVLYRRFVADLCDFALR